MIETDPEKKKGLKDMYDQLVPRERKEINKTHLALFVSDPEKCFNSLSNIIDKAPKETKHMADQVEIDLVNLYKKYDLNTLENLHKVGQRLNEKLEDKADKTSSNLGKYLLIGLAIITIVPIITIAIIKGITNYHEKNELHTQQQKATLVNYELQHERILENQEHSHKHVRNFVEALQLEKQNTSTISH